LDHGQHGKSNNTYRVDYDTFIVWVQHHKTYFCSKIKSQNLLERVGSRFISTTWAISLGDAVLNILPFTQHNEGAGACNEGSPKLLQLRLLRADIRHIFQQYTNRLETVLGLVLSFFKLGVI